MSHQGFDDKWGCILTANNESRFSGGEDDELVSEEVNKDDAMPRDG
jgi:hypothetical protein